MNLQELKNKEEAYVVELVGGKALHEKMACMNIREGKRITKLLSQPFSGPIIIDVDNRQYAIGRNIASKIIVNPK